MVFHQNRIALVYDFDGTLSPEAMQHYGVLPELGISSDEFWRGVKHDRRGQSAEELLVYMKRMIDLADLRRVKLDRLAFEKHGSAIQFFEGVPGWFDRINSYVIDRTGGAVEIEHYIISSGLGDMIRGCSIAKHFEEIYACEFLYDQYGHPIWPARVISDTSKTQYIFRINKGVLDVNESINSHMPEAERRIPFDQIIYFGDGDTDVPSMTVLMKNGGHAIAVFKPGESAEKCVTLHEAHRVDFFCEADYREGSVLDQTVKQTLAVICERILLRQGIERLINPQE